MTRFYGIPPNILARMPHVLLTIYAEQLMELQAEEALHGFLTADIPYAEKADRRRIFREWEKWLPEREDDAEKIDHASEAGRATAAMLGIGIVHEPSGIESPVAEDPDPAKEIA